MNETQEEMNNTTTDTERQSLVERLSKEMLAPTKHSGTNYLAGLSRLKQQRIRERARKKLKQMKRNVNSRRERVHNDAHAKGVVEKPFNAERAVWEEAKEVAVQVHGFIRQFSDIAAMAEFAIAGADPRITDEMKAALRNHKDVLLGDIASFNAKWDELAKELEGKSGEVGEMDFMIFYAVYEDYLGLQADAQQVLVEKAGEISDIIEAANSKPQEAAPVKAEEKVEKDE